MKRTFAVMMALGVVLLVAVAGAGAFTTPRMRANIPFSFYAGQELLPSGEYLIEMRDQASQATGSLLVIRNQEGTVFHFIAAKAGNYLEKNAIPHLVFRRYGASHYLGEVHQGNFQSSLRPSAAEKEIAVAQGNGRMPAAERVEVAAVR